MSISTGISIATVDDPVIGICINQQYPFCERTGDPDELYQCTRCLWNVNLVRAQQAEYAFAVYRGIIREVYKIEEWHPGIPTEEAYWIARFIQQGRKDKPKTKGRSGFTGELAPDRIRNKYVGKHFPERFQGPIRYLNCP